MDSFTLSSGLQLRVLKYIIVFVFLRKKLNAGGQSWRMRRMKRSGLLLRTVPLKQQACSEQRCLDCSSDIFNVKHSVQR